MLHRAFLALPLLAALSSAPAAAEEAAAPATVEAAATTEVAGTRVIVTLSDGQTLVGQALRRVDGGVQLTLEDGEVLELPAAAVAGLAPLGEGQGTVATHWGIDPNRTRYLYSPTAFPLGQGNGYVAQRALVLTTAAVGVTDFLDVELGTILPLLFTDAPVGILGAKVAGRVSEKLRLGGGAQALLIPVDGLEAGGFIFGNATWGTPDTHVTLAGGTAFLSGEGLAPMVVSTVGANHRLGPRIALVTENWFIFLSEGNGPWGIPFFAVPSGGVRLFGPSFAIDLALVPVISGEPDLPVLPLPWISFSWNWSLRKK